MANLKAPLLSKLTLWAALPVAFHVSRVLAWFSNVDFTSGVPLLNWDFSQYWARVLRAHLFLSETGWIWGYDPYEMGGYFSGLQDIGTTLLGIVVHLLSPLFSVGTSLLWIEFLGYLLSPFLLYLAGRVGGMSKRDSWTALCVGALTLFNVDMIGRAFGRSGLFPFYLGAFFSPLWVACLFRALKTDSWRWWAGTTVGAILLAYNHPACLLPLIPVAFLLFINFLPKNFLKAAAALIAVGVSCAPLINVIFYSGVTFSAVTHGLKGGFENIRILLSPFQATIDRSLFALTTTFMIALGFWAAQKSSASRKSKLSLIILLSILVLVPLFGNSLPLLREFHPIRFSIHYWLLLAFLSAAPLARFFSGKGPSAQGLKILAAAVIIGSLARADFSFRFNNTVPPSFLQLEALIKEQTDKGGRILLEATPFENSNLLDVLPLRVDRTFIGGPTWPNFKEGSFTHFWAFFLSSENHTVQETPSWLGKPLNEIDEGEMKDYFQLYNVDHVVASTPQMKKSLKKFSSVLTLNKSAGPFALYEVNLDSQKWFSEGSGDLQFGRNSLRIDNPSPGPLTLKFHWSPRLRSAPKNRLVPKNMLEDPIPFISVENAGKNNPILIYAE